LYNELLQSISELREEVRLLKNGKKSKTSHTPPSHEIGRPNTKNSRNTSGKPSGGQLGHEGSTLSFKTIPDAVLSHSPSFCSDCGFDLREVASVVADQADYGSRLSANALSGIMGTEDKNQSKAKLAVSLHTICTEINVQQEGHTTELESSGAPLAKGSSNNNGSITVTPKELEAKAGTEPTELDASVKKNPLVSDHGTMFAYTEAATAPADVNLWSMKYCTSHHQTIGGLKKGTNYMVAAAFQGPSNCKLVFCTPISVWTKMG